MKRLVAAFIAASLLMAAKPVFAASSIDVAPGSDLRFGGAVTFTVDVGERLKGNEYPMVYLECFSVVDGAKLTGQLDHADAVFILGSGWSHWYDQRDPASCIAHLDVYGGKVKGYDVIRELASTTFAASA